MCRWLAYSGSPVLLEDLLFKPENSLVVQSKHSRLGVETINGDGFGVGWYGARETPGIYHSTEPAWNDRNLRELSAHAAAGRVFAHIRATTGTAVQQTNCHPFRHGRWLWMHNGAIADFPTVKRDLTLAVEPALFPEIEGSTDSELFFFLALTFGLEDGPTGSGGPGGRPHRGDGATPRRRAPDPDDGGHHRRGDHVGVPLLQRGQVPIAVPQHRRRHAPCSSIPTTRSCTSSPTTPGSWCPSRSGTCGEPGGRCRSPPASSSTVAARSCVASDPRSPPHRHDVVRPVRSACLVCSRRASAAAAAETPRTVCAQVRRVSRNGGATREPGAGSRRRSGSRAAG